MGKKADRQQAPQSFEELASGASPGLVREFLGFLVHNTKWWLLPILIVLLLAGLLVVIGGTGLAPFIYTLF